MTIKTIALAVIAALLLTGTAIGVSSSSGQGAPLPQPQTTEAVPAALTEAQAVAAALDHAGLAETEVTELRAWMDRDDQIPHWEIHWRSSQWEYDYDIHPDTGQILDWDRDYEPVRQAQTPPTAPATEPPVTQSPASQHSGTDPALLTREEALAIALAHAGLTQDQISRPETEFDRDRGGPEWDVEFVSGGWEYSCEIHGETGEILSWDREWND